MSDVCVCVVFFLLAFSIRSFFLWAKTIRLSEYYVYLFCNSQKVGREIDRKHFFSALFFLALTIGFVSINAHFVYLEYAIGRKRKENWNWFRQWAQSVYFYISCKSIFSKPKCVCFVGDEGWFEDHCAEWLWQRESMNGFVFSCLCYLLFNAPTIYHFQSSRNVCCAICFPFEYFFPAFRF